jgi:hypothetical protein
MGDRKTGAEEALRIGKAIEAQSDPDPAGSYEVSSAFAAPARKKLMGLWIVEEHLIGGLPFIERFQTQQLRGARLGDAMFKASYEFREYLCIKKVEVGGVLATEEGDLPYEYHLSLALSWRPGVGKSLIVKPEIGYQVTMLEGSPLNFRELLDSGKESSLAYRFEGKDLVLEEGEDRRLLRRP